MYAALFDRFASGDDIGPESLARDVADLLGGRRAYSLRELGVVSWGMPSMASVTSRSPDARRRVAGYIAETLDRFEPRLQDLEVEPIEDAVEFTFRISARLVETDSSSSVRLRVLSPRIGGGLGASVVVLDINKYETEWQES